MNKFFGLVTNEYIKILCKVSTKVMLAVIVLAALGFNALMYVSSRPGNARHSFWTMTWEDRIRDAELRQYEGWEWSVKRYRYAMEHDIETGLFGHPDQWREWDTFTLFNWKQMEYRGLAAFDTGALITQLDHAIQNRDYMARTQALLAWNEMNKEVFLSQEQYVHHGSFLHHVESELWMYRAIIEHHAVPGSWQHALIMDLRHAKSVVAEPQNNGTVFDERRAGAEELILIGEYRLANDIHTYTFNNMENMHLVAGLNFSFWRIFSSSTQTIGLLSVLIIVVAGGILSSEFTQGTVKFLLINPVKRWKIFVAKYIAISSLGFVMLLALYISNLLFAGVFFGFGDLAMPHLSVVGGAVVRGSSAWYVASRYLLGAVGMMAIATFALALSSVTRSSALAIGLGVCLYFAGWIAVMILQSLGFYQAQFILFANTNLLNVINGTTGFIHHTVRFAVINILVYMVVFLWVAWDGFVRADIK